MDKIDGIVGKVTTKLPSLNNYKKVYLVQKIFQFINAGVLVLAAIVRFIYTKQIVSFSGYVLTFYLLLFAAIYICHEVSVSEFRLWFYFLNFGWGKGLFDLFIGCLCLGSGLAVEWLDILVGVYFIILSIGFGAISLVYRKNEVKLVDEMLLEIAEAKNVKHQKEIEKKAHA
jgi:hypothetical protein